MVAIDARALHFAYRGSSVLRSVDIAVDPGEVVSIVGANGAGKTTLLKCLAGLLTPKDGQITIGDRDLASLTRRELATKLALVPQAEPSRFPMTVFDAVLLGRRPYLGWYPKTHDLQIVASAIERLDLGPLALRNLSQLSGGERQKVAIARAIAQDAQILLLDEPTTYLDLKHQLTVLDIVRSLADDNTAVLMSIHDLNLAFRVSDRVVALHNGDVISDTTPQAITPETIERVYGIRCDIADTYGQRIVIPQRTQPAAATELQW